VVADLTSRVDAAGETGVQPWNKNKPSGVPAASTLHCKGYGSVCEADADFFFVAPMK